MGWSVSVSSSKTISHYGVKGMKWGVHKAKDASSNNASGFGKAAYGSLGSMSDVRGQYRRLEKDKNNRIRPIPGSGEDDRTTIQKIVDAGKRIVDEVIKGAKEVGKKISSVAKSVVDAGKKLVDSIFKPKKNVRITSTTVRENGNLTEEGRKYYRTKEGKDSAKDEYRRKKG